MLREWRICLRFIEYVKFGVLYHELFVKYGVNELYRIEIQGGAIKPL